MDENDIYSEKIFSDDGLDFIGHDMDAIRWLKQQGWRLTNHWNWYDPDNPDRNPDYYERDVGNYLFDEWDWGWFVNKLEEREKVVDKPA